MESTFQNRNTELETLLNPPSSLITVYGEAGIGKTRLLKEAVVKHKQRSPAAYVLWTDLAPLSRVSSRLETSLLRLLIEEAEGNLHGVWTDEQEVVAGIVEQLREKAQQNPALLVFDNSEALQEEGEFWRWLELNLVGPLLSATNLYLIFVGRIPPPWRRFEVRQALTVLPLKPLDLEAAGNALILDVLSQFNESLDPEAQQEAATLVNDLAFGHPLLSEKVAAYVAPRWPPDDLEAFQVEVCRDVVKPFIQETFFANIESPWDEWLWSMSVLDWFDTTILPTYLAQLDPEKVEEKSDFYFIQEISRLRVEKRILWQEERGDCMHGVIGDIVEQCLEILEPERYRCANIAAAKTFETIAEQFNDDPFIQDQYKDQAELYRQRAEKA